MLSSSSITTRAADLSPASPDGTVPATITYKGTLTDAGGSPVTTTISAVFTIYDQPAQGSAQWVETREITSDADGRFTILLGKYIPLPNSVLATTPLYLGVQAGADTGISPRTVITPLSSDTSGTINRIANVLPDGSGGLKGVRDAGGNVGGGVSVTGVRDPGGNIDGAKSS